jgi:hypothetical protein
MRIPIVITKFLIDVEDGWDADLSVDMEGSRGEVVTFSSSTGELIIYSTYFYKNFETVTMKTVDIIHCQHLEAIY